MIPVWTFWEGPRWPYIDLCLETIQRQCVGGCEARVLDLPAFDRLIGPSVLNPAWRKLEWGIATDCIRAALLATYGGFWFDADTIALRSPAKLATLGMDVVHVTWTKKPRRVVAGYLYMRKGCDAAVKWLENINRNLAAGNCGWTVLGEQSLGPAVAAADPEKVLEVPRSTFLPIDIDCNVTEFFSEHNWQDHASPASVCYGLNHSWFVSRYPTSFRLEWDKVRKSPLLIHRLLWYAKEKLA